MSTRPVTGEFDVEEPTAVRHMHEALKSYEKNAKRGLKKLHETWRKKTSSSPPPAPMPEGDAAEAAVADDDATDDEEKKEPSKKDP